MLITQLLGGFDDLGDGFVAGEQREEEAVCGLGWRDSAEEVGRLGHGYFKKIAPKNKYDC